jgi:hypothetical protein
MAGIKIERDFKSTLPASSPPFSGTGALARAIAIFRASASFRAEISVAKKAT